MDSVARSVSWTLGRGPRLPALPAAGRVARGAAAADPPRRFRGEDYWARPLRGLRRPGGAAGDRRPRARRRTGPTGPGGCSPATAPATGSTPRCTGPGYANQPDLGAARRRPPPRGAYVTAVVRCAPPANRPTPEERDNCLPYLERELELLERVPGDRRPRRASPGTARCGRCAGWAPRCRARSRASATAPRRRSGAGRCSAATTRASRTPSPGG